MEQEIINDNFRLILDNYTGTRGNYLPVDKDNFIVHFFLDYGYFEAGTVNIDWGGLALTLEANKKVFNARPPLNQTRSGFIGNSLMLQLLELIKVLDQTKKDMTAIRIMVAALCSTALNNRLHPGNALDFREMKSVYAVVQEWKEAKRRIGGTFNLYKPEGMTRKRFLFLVNELYDSPASELIYNLNMQQALGLLIFSNELINSISELLGYSHKENFITAFRYTFGITPGHLRRQFRL